MQQHGQINERSADRSHSRAIPHHIGIVLIIAVAAIFFSAPLLGQQPDDENNRRVVSRPTPVYPALARTMHVAGTVKLLDSRGCRWFPARDPMGGHPLLAEAATNAVKKWKWARSSEMTTEAVEIRFNPD